MTPDDRTPCFRSGVQLAIAAVAVTVLWLVVLPWIASRPRMAAHLQWLDNRGIDPSAMFYTDLESSD